MQMPPEHVKLFLVRRLDSGLPGHRVGNLPENPRVALRRAADRHAVAARLLAHPQRVLPAGHVAVADHGDGHAPLELPDGAPIGAAFVKLASRARVQRNHLRAALLRQLPQQQIGFTPCFKPQPHLDRHRHMRSLRDRRDDFRRAHRLLHQRAALAVADDFGHGAAHVDIQQRIAPAARQFLRRARHDFRLVAEKLQGHRAAFALVHTQ